MNKYREKKQSRIIRYKELAAKMEKQSNALAKRADELSRAFEGGQPILVGHHSEKRARRLQQTMHRKMDKSLEFQKKAKYYKQRAESVESNTAISSDDPEAKQKLMEKIKTLNERQERMKGINKIVRSKKISGDKKLEMLINDFQLSKIAAVDVLINGIPAYKLNNNRANIKAAENRLQELERMESIPESYEVINDIALHVDKEANRVRLIFPSIPNEATRTTLKRAGFVWSPSTGSWVRKISREAIRQGKQLITDI